MNNPNDRSLQRAAQVADERFGLVAMWLHGSHAKGHAGPQSDVDLAVLLTDQPTAIEKLSLQADMAAAIGAEVDLAVLDRDSSPILFRQLIKHGRLIVDGDATRRAYYALRMMTAYHDLKISRRRAEERLVERLRDAG